MLNNQPRDWNVSAHKHWSNNQRGRAIQCVIAAINSYGAKKPIALVLQLAYYFFIVGDPGSAAQVLDVSRKHYPHNTDLLLNLGVCLSRIGRYEQAVIHLNELLLLKPESEIAYDSLANCYSHLNLFAAAKVAGSRALKLKDDASHSVLTGLTFPTVSPQLWLMHTEKKHIISFSLWGDNPRYLRGAIDNVLLASTIYPDWSVRIYLDLTVPSEIQQALSALGADIYLEAPDQTLFQRLTWRFKVANDPCVGRFIVRDIDSVIDEREQKAVTQWVASDCWFHVMRDWWTHTDLILAGMWGGIANILPSLEDAVAVYNPVKMETPNIDQWFLREQIWPRIRSSVLVHDRYFSLPHSKPWPGPSPLGDRHVGQNVFSAQPDEQQVRIAAWIAKLNSLQIET